MKLPEMRGKLLVGYWRDASKVKESEESMLLIVFLFPVFNERFFELVFALDIRMLSMSSISGTKTVMLQRSCLRLALKPAPSERGKKGFRQRNDIITCPSACPLAVLLSSCSCDPSPWLAYWRPLLYPWSL